jgi:hypothetical protein
LRRLWAGLAQALGRRGKPSRQRDDQAPRRGFGRPQQPEHGAMEMTWQRRVATGAQGRICAGEPGDGDERGHDALQRLAVLLDRCIPVHRRLPSSKHSSDYRPREEGVNKRERIFSVGNSQVPGITGKDFLPIRRARKIFPAFQMSLSDQGRKIDKLTPFPGGEPCATRPARRGAPA